MDGLRPGYYIHQIGWGHWGIVSMSLYLIHTIWRHLFCYRREKWLLGRPAGSSAIIPTRGVKDPEQGPQLPARFLPGAAQIISATLRRPVQKIRLRCRCRLARCGPQAGLISAPFGPGSATFGFLFRPSRDSIWLVYEGQQGFSKVGVLCGRGCQDLQK